MIRYESADSTGMRGWAVFSADGLFRYELGRSWGPEDMRVTLVMVGINPSKADHKKDDQTVRKGVGFAKRAGLTRFIIVNPFARIFTDQKDLTHAFKSGADVVGPDNDRFFIYNPAFDHAGRIVVAHGKLPGPPELRARAAGKIEMFRLAHAHSQTLWCLGRNADGSPRHPLRLSYSTKLERW